MKFLLLATLILANTARAAWVGHHAGANQLLLSGDGKVAFSVGSDQTRVWDVEGRHELAALPGRALAVASDGRRVLCRSRKQGINGYDFWRRTEGEWQRGTSVARRANDLPLLDAIFDGDEALLMWLGRLERLAPDGTRRTSRPFDEGDRLALGAAKTSPPVGALSPDGKQLVLWDRGWARVCDATTGRRLRPLHTFEDVGSFNFPSWPNDKDSLLFQVRATPSTWKLERRDARTNAVLPLNLSKPGLPERWLFALIFADDGKSYVALDETGDIWAEDLN